MASAECDKIDRLTVNEIWLIGKKLEKIEPVTARAVA
jgi:hypothetical protein